ncbi:ParA family protein [Caryophanon latum]|uniref:Chromosome partitioning protein ParA n=1 Tax=Caryophanon latum TaxID=33977 RepID=A0A1C0YP29_9BACL|nr:AAA family ATPase [Caryophanon latum]OCS88913.1 chromosome partitioning protein ParA [Caryophanon latum]
MTRNGKVISLINMKGGVGKTTLSVGIADYLAEYFNKDENYKVLLIDMDPQFNSTQALFEAYYKGDYFKDIFSIEKTVSKFFKPQVNFTEVYQSPPADELVVELTDNLHIICGDLNLVLANKSADYSHTKRLRRFIHANKLKEKYDFIIIDCPPTLTIYTESALLASDYYVIPNRLDIYSLIGIKALQQSIGHLISEEGINLQCAGLIHTLLDDNLTKKQQDLKNRFESMDEVEDLYIFTAYMSLVRDIQVGKQGPLPTRYKKSRDDLHDICLELMNQIQ